MTAAEQPFHLYTSIHPRLSGEALPQQREIIASWRAAGFTPVTVNGPGEITQIADYDLGIAIESVSDNGKPLVCDILTAVRRRGGKRAAIVNSDCKMIVYPNLASRLAASLENGLLYAERIDFGDGRPMAIGDCNGFDAFFFDVALLEQVNDRQFRLGETWWDYWFPLQLAASGAVLGNIDWPLVLHRRHNFHWSLEQWEINGRHLWGQMKTWSRQKALPEFFSSQGDTIEPNRQQLTELALACFGWLRARRLPQGVTCLPTEMQSIEGFLRQTYDSLVSVPPVYVDIFAAEKLQTKKRVHWLRRLFDHGSARASLTPDDVL